MKYGEILTDTLTLLWKRKKLWGIALIGQIFSMLLMGLYMGSIFGVQMRIFPRLMNGGGTPEEMHAALLSWMPKIVFLAILFFLFLIASYLFALIGRGGSISEAGVAWEGEAVRMRRGLRAGVRKAPALFVIDLLWGLPSLLMAGLMLFSLGASMSHFFSIMQNGSAIDDEAFFKMFGSMMGGMMLVICLGWLYHIFRSIFSPLMYQSAVIGRKSLRAAIAEGWRLAASHIGPMVIFWLLTLAISLAVSLVMQMLMTPLSMGMMGPWMKMMGEQAPAAPSSTSWLLIVLAAAGSGLVMWLSMSLLQAFTLTLYARVYRELLSEKAKTSAPDDSLLS
ncbi:MAG: hypothetical protein DSY55_05080 [Clostridia bacterium]|nr:MAG: hypothetical protein DSY55_05080 [Clostridia bacterium]